MKIICLFFPVALLSSFTSTSQSRHNPKQQTSKTGQVEQTAAAKSSMKSAADSIKWAINDAKSSFNTLFKSHKDTAAIAISNVEYEDSNLANLKECLKRLKGVKSVSEEYKSSNAVLRVPYKGKPTDLWDQLPASVRAPFRLVEAGDHFISLKFKDDKN